MEETVKSTNSGYGKRPMWQWVVLYLIIGAIVYGIIYYFAYGNKGGYTNTTSNENYNNSTNSTTNINNTNPTNAPTGETQASPSSSASKEITVEGSEFAFSPSAITVKQGEEVKITFKNTGKYPHNLAISDLNVQTKTIRQGEEDTVTFTPDKKGSFEIICTLPNHADRGMKGTLTVE